MTPVLVFLAQIREVNTTSFDGLIPSFRRSQACEIVSGAAGRRNQRVMEVVRLVIGSRPNALMLASKPIDTTAAILRAKSPLLLRNRPSRRTRRKLIVPVQACHCGVHVRNSVMTFYHSADLGGIAYLFRS